MAISPSQASQITSNFIQLRQRWRLSSVFRELNDQYLVRNPQDTAVRREMLPYIPFLLAYNGSEVGSTAPVFQVAEDDAIDGKIITLSEAKSFETISVSGKSGDIRLITPDTQDLALDLYNANIENPAVRNAAFSSVYDTSIEAAEARRRFDAGMAEILNVSDGSDYKRMVMLMLRAWLEEPLVLHDEGRMFWNLKSLALTTSKHPEGIIYWGTVEPGGSFTSTAPDAIYFSDWSFTMTVVKIEGPVRKQTATSVEPVQRPPVPRTPPPVTNPPPQLVQDLPEQIVEEAPQEPEEQTTEDVVEQEAVNAPPPIVEEVSPPPDLTITSDDQMQLTTTDPNQAPGNRYVLTFECANLPEFITKSESGTYSFTQNFTLSEPGFQVVAPTIEAPSGATVDFVIDDDKGKLSVSGMSDLSTVRVIYPNNSIQTFTEPARFLIPHVFEVTAGPACVPVQVPRSEFELIVPSPSNTSLGVIRLAEVSVTWRRPGVSLSSHSQYRGGAGNRFFNLLQLSTAATLPTNRDVVVFIRFDASGNIPSTVQPVGPRSVGVRMLQSGKYSTLITENHEPLQLSSNLRVQQSREWVFTIPAASFSGLTNAGVEIYLFLAQSLEEIGSVNPETWLPLEGRPELQKALFPNSTQNDIISHKDPVRRLAFVPVWKTSNFSIAYPARFDVSNLVET